MLIIVIETHKADFLERRQSALKNNNNNNFLSIPQNVQKEKSREEISSLLIIAKDLSTRSNTSRLQICWGQCTALLLVKQCRLRESSSQGSKRLPGIPQLGGVSNILLKLTPPSRGLKRHCAAKQSQSLPLTWQC